jgi:hypothetical protein
MLADVNTIDPWVQTIGLLSSPKDITSASAAVASQGSHMRSVVDAEYRCVVVSLIDRPTRTTATIAWRESTRCCYGDQAWRMSRAHTVGTCAMSGRTIQPGEPVYKPNGRPVPRNAEAMILVSVLDDATPL